MAMIAFPQHILDYIKRRAESDSTPLNANEDEMLANERRNQEFLNLPTANPSGADDLTLLKSIHGDTIPDVSQAPQAKEKEESKSTEEEKSQPKGPEQFTLDVGQQRGDVQKDLANAQQARDEIILRNKVAEAGKQIGAAISGATGAPIRANEEAMQRANAPIQDYLMKLKMDEQDPNSPTSKAFRQFAQKYGINIQGDFTASMGKELLPFMFKSFEMEENRKMREQLMKMKTDEMKMIKQQAQEEKEKHQENQDYESLSKRLTAEISSPRSAFGSSAKVFRAAEAIENLASRWDANNLTTRDIQELARQLDSMISGGASTIAGSNKLIPHSWSGDAAKIGEYITNQPKGAGQAAFVKRILDAVKGQKELARQQMERTQSKLLGGYMHLPQKNENRFKEFLRVNELPEDLLDRALGKTSVPQENESEEVNVMSPDGIPGTIPKSQLQDALAQGYKKR